MQFSYHPVCARIRAQTPLLQKEGTSNAYVIDEASLADPDCGGDANGSAYDGGGLQFGGIDDFKVFDSNEG